MKFISNPLNILKKIVKPNVKILSTIPNSILSEIVGEKKDVKKYISKNWKTLSEEKKEKIFLHSIKNDFAPKSGKVQLGRWGYPQTIEGGNYPW